MARKSVPNYVKIHDALKDEVEKGIWKIGQRLPSERDLAERFTVRRMTARQAVTAWLMKEFLTVVWVLELMLLADVFAKKCVEQLPLQKLSAHKVKFLQQKF